MSTLTIDMSAAHLAASSHSLLNKRSNMNFLKFIAKRAVERCHELEYYELNKHVQNAYGYIMSYPEDIEKINFSVEDNKFEDLCFTFNNNSDTSLNLAYSILIIIKAIAGNAFSAEMMTGQFHYLLNINDKNEIHLTSYKYENIYYDSYEALNDEIY